MLFRLMGKMPLGKFEFTCPCGKWNASQINDNSMGARQEFKCEDCGKIIRIWQQGTHWHLSVES